MAKIHSVSMYSVSFTGNSKDANKKQLYMKMDQQTLLTIGVLSASLGVIRSIDAFQHIKLDAAKVKHPLLKALFSGALTAGFMASLLGIFQIRYSDKK